MPDRIRFLRSDRVEEVEDCPPTRTILDYLREDRRLKGTKEGCAEGDCGACTVVVAERAGDGIRYRAVNACIQFLATLDGKWLITVEDLAGTDALHPVQQAMVDQHGSQCGFCTPGFVMALFAMFHEHADHAASRAEIDLGLAGNLCRCTGYAPIVRAAEQVLRAGRHDGFDARAEASVERLESIARNGSLAIDNRHGRFYAPRSSAELAAQLKAHPEALLVGGATDVGLWVTKQLRTFPVLIHTGRVGELLELHCDRERGVLVIGAAVSYSDALEAIAEHYPGFREVLERLGGRQVRNAGTIGGNIANGSPIGDMPPGLIAAGSRLVLCSAGGRRTVDLENFFLDYGEQDLREGEFVERILLPLPGTGLRFATYKVSKRFEQDISAVCAAFAIDQADGRIRTARVAFGGMAATPRRALACEAALTGAAWDRATASAAQRALEDDFSPISDWRASAAYRMQLARNLLLRFYLETTQTPRAARLPPKYGGPDA